MKNFPTKQCKECSEDYVPTGPAAKYCERCSREIHLENQRRGNKVYRKKLGCKIDVGKGGATPIGPEHPQWKTGSRAFNQRMNREYKDKVRYCERCNKDLLEASCKFWCVHHKDHNRHNNVEPNFELLCKRCHQIEHECWKAFEGATTISKESTPKQVEAPDNLNG